ncbi:MAG: PTS sugar transporter subunit IIA [Micavibrio sp.]|nr:PTS sugar transporter subunit IIA [Micavibrio sp.]
MGSALNARVDNIELEFAVQNREQFLREISTELSDISTIEADKIFSGFMNERRLKRAPLGEGIAIFDMRVRGLPKPIVKIMTLSRDIDMGASDGSGVRVVGVILSPEREGMVHLRRLSRLARTLKDKNFHQALLNASKEDEIWAMLTPAIANQSIAA